MRRIVTISEWSTDYFSGQHHTRMACGGIFMRKDVGLRLYTTVNGRNFTQKVKFLLYPNIGIVTEWQRLMCIGMVLRYIPVRGKYIDTLGSPRNRTLRGMNTEQSGLNATCFRRSRFESCLHHDDECRSVLLGGMS